MYHISSSIEWTTIYSTSIPFYSVVFVFVFEQIENNAALEKSGAKQTALMQYHTLMNDLNAYERENYDKFLAKGTQVVNTILKKNIIKLEFCHLSAGKYQALCCYGILFAPYFGHPFADMQQGGSLDGNVNDD